MDMRGLFLFKVLSNRGYKYNSIEIHLLTRIQDTNKGLVDIRIYKLGIITKTLMGQAY